LITATLRGARRRVTNAATWTRLSRCRFAPKRRALQLRVLAYNPANFLRTLALPTAAHRSVLVASARMTTRKSVPY